MTWNQTWVEDALCAQADPELFFPANQGQTRESRMAKEMCGQCPVQVPCLEYALHNAEWGIWSGTSMNERTQMRRQRGIKLFTGWVEHGTEAGARAHHRRGETACQSCAKAAQLARRERQAKKQ